MKRFSTLSLAVALAACGGGEPAENASSAPAETAAPAATAPTAPSGEMTMPDWMHVDEAARTVHLTVTAGLTNAKNYWNFNGGYDGNMTITVPEGFTVTVELVNKDPMMAHSLGIVSQTSGFGAMPEASPVFEGAVTENAGSMTDATMPEETETIRFVAATAGSYSMICLIPGHAATGMYVHFNVSADGRAGVQGAM